jgi:hypothetical protein
MDWGWHAAPGSQSDLSIFGVLMQVAKRGKYLARMSLQTHDRAVRVGERHGLSIDDEPVVAAAVWRTAEPCSR